MVCGSVRNHQVRSRAQLDEAVDELRRRSKGDHGRIGADRHKGEDPRADPVVAFRKEDVRVGRHGAGGTSGRHDGMDADGIRPDRTLPSARL